jgi:hypothetical protein
MREKGIIPYFVSKLNFSSRLNSKCAILTSEVKLEDADCELEMLCVDSCQIGFTSKTIYIPYKLLSLFVFKLQFINLKFIFN